MRSLSGPDARAPEPLESEHREPDQHGGNADADQGNAQADRRAPAVPSHRRLGGVAVEGIGGGKNAC